MIRKKEPPPRSCPGRGVCAEWRRGLVRNYTTCLKRGGKLVCLGNTKVIQELAELASGGINIAVLNVADIGQMGKVHVTGKGPAVEMRDIGL